MRSGSDQVIIHQRPRTHTPNQSVPIRMESCGTAVSRFLCAQGGCGMRGSRRPSSPVCPRPKRSYGPSPLRRGSRLPSIRSSSPLTTPWGPPKRRTKPLYRAGKRGKARPACMRPVCVGQCAGGLGHRIFYAMQSRADAVATGAVGTEKTSQPESNRRLLTSMVCQISQRT